MQHQPTITGTPLKVQIALAFADDFELSNDIDTPTTLTADELDRWGIANGHYDVTTCHQSAANMDRERNMLRQHINTGAVHDDFTIMKDAFKVEVHKRAHKDDVTGEWLPTVFRVVAAARAFATDSIALTKKVNTVVTTRRNGLKKLLDHADWGSMPPDVYAQAKQQLRSINNWATRARLETQLLEQDFDSFYQDLLIANEDAAALLTDES